MSLRHEQVAPSTFVHGSGEIGGKGEGLLRVDQIGLKAARRLTTHILTSELYERYRSNGDALDREVVEQLRLIHLSFAGAPIGVRGSETFENDPLIPTSGIGSSYMLPNNHPRQEARFDQFLRAIGYIYDKFARRHSDGDAHRGLAGAGRNTVSILVNPIPGVSSDSLAGRFFYPMSSGIADSFFKQPLVLDDGPQDPAGGFARVAFGHGYAVVRDAFEVIPLATITNPLRPSLWLMKKGHPDLADQIRPIHGEGETLQELIAALGGKQRADA
jgi:hypothetical protein